MIPQSKVQSKLGSTVHAHCPLTCGVGEASSRQTVGLWLAVSQVSGSSQGRGEASETLSKGMILKQPNTHLEFMAEKVKVWLLWFL